jgi:uncharacterized coiled-coil protein SlyX
MVGRGQRKVDDTILNDLNQMVTTQQYTKDKFDHKLISCVRD